MPTSRTNTTGTALLGMLALRPSWPIYALTKQLRRNLRFFWPRAESRIYDEAKSLVARGLATTEPVRVAGRAQTQYTITDAGRATVRSWLATPPRPTSLECEPLLRILLLEVGEPHHATAALDRITADSDAILEVGRVVAEEYLAGTAPFQDQVHVRALVFDFLTHHALMLREWSERTRATVTEWQGLDPSERARRARELIETVRSEFPRVE